MAFFDAHGGISHQSLVLLTNAWLEAYEKTMCSIHDIDYNGATIFLGRQCETHFKWIPVPGTRGCKYPKTCLQARAWYWFGDRLEEIGKIRGSSAQAITQRHHLWNKVKAWKPAEQPEHGFAPADLEKESKHPHGLLADDANSALLYLNEWRAASNSLVHTGTGYWMIEARRLGKVMNQPSTKTKSAAGLDGRRQHAQLEGNVCTDGLLLSQGSILRRKPSIHKASPRIWWRNGARFGKPMLILWILPAYKWVILFPLPVPNKSGQLRIP